MLRIKKKRIACITYHKYPKEDWATEEFREYRIESMTSNMIKVQLAERGTLLSKNLWVREVRKLTKSGYQTSIISTDYCSDLTQVASEMFDRWCQENFVKYMRQHYNIDRLVDYSLESIPETTRVINPEYRRLDGIIRLLAAKHSRELAKFAAIHLEGEIEVAEVEDYQQKKNLLLEGIQSIELELSTAKQQRKGMQRHINISQLPEEERFKRLATPRKHLLDTIKMIAYRAETAMANILGHIMKKSDERRSLLRSIYQTEADLIPDEKNATLTVKLHHLANHVSDQALQNLCDEINQTNTIFPRTNLRLIYKLGAT